jgi:hypothetical protein
MVFWLMEPTVWYAFRYHRVALVHARNYAANAECNSAIPVGMGRHTIRPMSRIIYQA